MTLISLSRSSDSQTLAFILALLRSSRWLLTMLSISYVFLFELVIFIRMPRQMSVIHGLYFPRLVVLRFSLRRILQL